MSELIDTIATKEDVTGEVSSLRKDIQVTQKDVFRWMLFFALSQTAIFAAMLLVLS
ncbi:hypothetical protein [Mucilaginibacter sp. PPCGB 2223]|uniref:hypothetical protein n=1 Tax=Mucilaginibacter sp. PPCGB 2223 TaxID=1886027 RepID=UPI001586CFDC|nr:hypothetical protein [Mucilaginibacter sp. PPCGB 2223]